MSTHIPETYGGLEFGVLGDVILAKDNAWGCTGISTIIVAKNLTEAPVIVAGTENQKKEVPLE